MGLRNWIIKKFILKTPSTIDIKKEIAKSQAEVAADKYLETSSKDHQDAMRLANKIYKGKLLSGQAREVMQKVKDLDADAEEQSKDSMEEIILAAILPAIMGGAAKPKPQAQDGFYADPNLQSSSADLPPQIADAIQNLTPEQLEKIKKEFIK